MSRFAVVVLSENYATSKWCLMELQLIMELMSVGRLQVIPVFYGAVDPSVVRHQRGSFDLEMYKGTHMTDEVPKWREALRLISSLAGVESRNCIDEATMVGEIATNISRHVSLMRKIDSGNFVGVKALIDDLNTLLDLKSSEARIIMGIWGMGGIGKTTIAKYLFDQLSPEFSARCFIENIKSIYKDNSHDLMNLQKKLLGSILPIGDDLRFWSVEAGHQEIKARLGNHKVLLVMDGVDKVPQVHALAKDTSWFGPGSRIIITTRDRGLLNSCGVKTLYEVKCLDDKNSLQMFKQIAFEGGSPPEGFEQLSVRASQLAHGLPSAIKAHALFLHGRSDSLEEWEEAVCGLESSLDEYTSEILKISYEGLSSRPHYQNVFLHVACLFNGETLQRVISLLGSRAESSVAMRVLAEKSLLKISTNGCVIMHKLVEQMGRQIMHNCRKFLGDPEEIRHALAITEGTKNTECMSLHMCEMTYPLSLTTSDVFRMHNLKFLKVYKHLDDTVSTLQLTLDSDYMSFSNMRLFHWDVFPLKILPSWSLLRCLVELNLRHSNLERLWSKKSMFMELKRLDVTGSRYLKRLPDLLGDRSLEELILEHCTGLEGIPKCIGKHSTLKKLKLSYRNKKPLNVSLWDFGIILQFPDGTVSLDELMNLSIEGDMLVDFHSDIRGYADYLSFTSEQQTPVTSKTSVHQAPRPSSEFNNFNSLIIAKFRHKEIFRPLTLYGFPDFPNLKELKLINLNMPKIPNGIHQLKVLEKLDLSGNDFENLPEAMSSLSRLKTLWLRNCFKLEELPKLTQVQTLTLTNCNNLRSLVKPSDTSQAEGSYCLLELCLENCNSVESLSHQLSHFAVLTYLDLSSHDFETLPPSISDLTSLVTLCLNNCKNLKSVGKLPVNLQFLKANGCDSLEADSVGQSKDGLNKEVNPRNDCFQETEMPKCVRNQQGIRSHQIIRLPKSTTALMFVGIPICIALVAVLVILFLCVFK